MTIGPRQAIGSPMDFSEMHTISIITLGYIVVKYFFNGKYFQNLFCAFFWVGQVGERRNFLLFRNLKFFLSNPFRMYRIVSTMKHDSKMEGKDAQIFNVY